MKARINDIVFKSCNTIFKNTIIFLIKEKKRSKISEYQNIIKFCENESIYISIFNFLKHLYRIFDNRMKSLIFKPILNLEKEEDSMISAPC